MTETNIKLLPGLVTLVTIIFIIAKIFDKFDYSWWIVFSPVWIMAIIVMFIFIIGIIIYALMEWFS